VSEEPDRPGHDDVRRLLADARHTEPIPADVADRMDEVLSGLRSEGEPVHVAEVIPLDAQRRRRAAGLLAAAAVIVVGGVVAAQQLPLGSAPQSAGSSADRATPGLTSGNGNSAQGTTGPEHQPTPQDSGGRSPEPLRTKAGGLLVRARHFSADALAGRQVLDGVGATTTDGLKLANVSPRCLRPPADSQVVRATYRRAPAALVYHAPAGSTQVVDLFVCGTARPVRSVTLSTP
jgi:hypothetical protein